MKTFLPILLILIVLSCKSQKEIGEISSPSGNLKAVITAQDRSISYSIVVPGQDPEIVVMPASPLGLQRNDGSFHNDLKIDSLSAVTLVSESYTMPSGKQKNNNHRANEAVLYLTNSSGKKLNIVFRVSDDAVAFRYIFPGNSPETFSVLYEKTGFRIPETADGWMSPYERPTRYGLGSPRLVPER